MAMKFLMCGVVASAILAPAAHARAVDLQTFGANASTPFVLGEKKVPKTAKQSVLIDAEAPTVLASSDRAKAGVADGDLAADFQSLPVSEPVVSMENGRPSRLPVVPLWMRSGRPGPVKPAYRYFSAPRSAVFSVVDTMNIPASCFHDVYRPKGLKRDVELRRARYYNAMVSVACQIGVPVSLFDALLTQESGYNPMALSPKGAIGIAQLMPDTARLNGVFNAWDPVENMRGGARVLKANLAEFGRYDLALAAYNAGPGRVRQRGSVPRFRETLAYVSNILSDVRRQFTAHIGYGGQGSLPQQGVRRANYLSF